MHEFTIAAWLTPYIGAAIILLLYKTGDRVKGYVAVLSILIAALVSTYAALLVHEHGKPLYVAFEWVESLDVTIGAYFDSLSSLMALVVSWLSFLIAVYSLEYMGEDPGQTRYWFFFSFFVGSMMLLVLSDNLITMFIGWEGTGLASYALIGHWFTDEEERWVGDPGRKALGIQMWFEPSHSGLRALVFTRLGDVGLLVGIAVLHLILGSTGFYEILEGAKEWSSLLYMRGLLGIFLALFILGALAKSAQFPFHEWLVTAMTGPTSVSALIHAATMVKAGVYFLLRFVPIFVVAEHALEYLHLPGAGIIKDFFAYIALIGAFTAFLMATMAVVSRELKLILAFSTASQLGYMFLGTAAGALTGESLLGVIAGFSHLASHAIFKASLFLAAGAIIHAVHSRFIDDMGGLAKDMRVTFIAMTLAALSLAGLPPFMGFWSKDMVLLAGYESKASIPLLLGVVTAGLTAAYTFRMIFRVFLYKTSGDSHHEHHVHEPGKLMLVPYTLLAILSLLFGLAWPFIEEGILEWFARGTLGIEEGVVHIGIEPELAAPTLTIVFAGIFISYYVYQYRLATPMTYISRNSILNFLHKFLYDRWFINSIYYKVLVRGFRTLSVVTYKFIDRLVVDNFYHIFLPTSFMRLALDTRAKLEHWIDEGFHIYLVNGILGISGRVRRIQNGILNYYIVMLWLGLSIILIFLWLLMGWPI